MLIFLLFCSERDKLVFDIMDEDSNNKISYEEFFEPSQSVQKALARAELAGRSENCTATGMITLTEAWSLSKKARQYHSNAMPIIAMQHAEEARQKVDKLEDNSGACMDELERRQLNYETVGTSAVD